MWVCGPSMSVVVRQRFIRRAGWRGDGLAQVVRALSSGSPSGPGRLPMPLRFAGAAPSLLRSVGAAAPLVRENGRGCRGGGAAVAGSSEAHFCTGVPPVTDVPGPRRWMVPAIRTIAAGPTPPVLASAAVWLRLNPV